MSPDWARKLQGMFKKRSRNVPAETELEAMIADMCRPKMVRDWTERLQEAITELQSIKPGSVLNGASPKARDLCNRIMDSGLIGERYEVIEDTIWRIHTAMLTDDVELLQLVVNHVDSDYPMENAFDVYSLFKSYGIADPVNAVTKQRIRNHSKWLPVTLALEYENEDVSSYDVLCGVLMCDETDDDLIEKTITMGKPATREQFMEILDYMRTSSPSLISGML